MAKITKAHPAATNPGAEPFTGPNWRIIAVDYIASVAAETSPDEAQHAAYQALSQHGTIVHVGPLIDSNTQQNFIIETSDTAARMQTSLRALGNSYGTNSFDFSANTVTATQLSILTANVLAE